MCEISVQICSLKIWTPVTLNVFHVFPHDNICKTFTVMHNRVFGHSDTLLFALPFVHSGVAFPLLFSIYLHIEFSSSYC